MVAVDRVCCAYCGSCVSVCPVGALDLQETRLVVSPDCIECNLCHPPARWAPYAPVPPLPLARDGCRMLTMWRLPLP